ncbi:hypothetical protein XELAEV_18033995mg [Xenopus laevis]|uniref:Transmembrane protein 65 n=1 Tax=Xenopus laevis TaxID=8355 RepID=A0A974CLV3_XENLA|nr:hypothetical protein XELAEV_18033995mg [Xenopus laevis]
MSMLPFVSRTALRPAVYLKTWSRLGVGKQQCTGGAAMLSCRLLGTHPRKEPIESLNTAQGAKDFIYSLHATERSCLLRELHKFESIAIAQEKLEVDPPSSGQLKHGISTMAAAALGNLVSDLAGLGLAGYVEAISSRLGLPIPDLTPKQADMWQTRLSAHLGKAIGVTIGCILGMFPLLFFSWDEEENAEKKK